LSASKAGYAGGGESCPQIAQIRNIADFEREYANYPIEANLKDAAAFQADTVLLCIGENVPKLATQAEQDRFKAAVKELLTFVKGNGSPALPRRSGVLWLVRSEGTSMKRTERNW
jgi:hypothetical protein